MPDSLGGDVFSMPFLRGTSQFSERVGSLVVIGAGRMGSHHINALGRAQHWNLVGVYDRHPGVGSRSQEELVQWLEERKPEAAIVAVPSEAHDSVARACLKSGCHVLLEKPLCPSAASARALADAFSLAGRILFGGHTERFNPVFGALLAQRERIGHLTKIETWRTGPAPQRRDPGGVVLDLAIHDLDLVLRMIDSPITLLAAQGRIHEDHLHEIRSQFDLAGVQIDVLAEWSEQRSRGIRLTGDRGVLEADLLARTLRLRTEFGVTEIDVVWSDPLESEHAAFAAASRGEFDSKSDLESQIRAIELAEAILAGASLSDQVLQ